MIAIGLAVAVSALQFGGEVGGRRATAAEDSPIPAVHARDDQDAPAFPAPVHPVPRLKASLEGFSVDTPFGSSVSLIGAHFEMYPLSQRWVRGGVGIAGGTGRGDIVGGSAKVQYGLLGANLGVQYSARITPFVEGHLAGGFMSASVDRPITVSGVTIDDASGTTWLYTRGIDAGAEFYAFGRAYLSASFGWMRATWGSPDIGMTAPGSSAEIRFSNVTSDSLMWKIGFGI